MAAQEAYVQVAPDSTGKKIRNLQLDVLQADGTTATVEMQVVNIVDEDGKQYSLGAPLTVTDNEVRALLAEIRDLLEQIRLEIGS